jgi:hypothetical protein
MPKALTGIARGKNHPNTYDGNLVMRHDDNPAINTYPETAPMSIPKFKV